MKVKFKNKVYKKNGRNGFALKNLCFDIFKQFLELHQGMNYQDIQDIFNKWHCNNNFVVLSQNDWEQKTENLRGRYFEPIDYNGLKLYFSTQWGNNGGDCDNINNMIEFAKGENYDIEVLEFQDNSLNNFYGLWTPRNNQEKIDKCLKNGIWDRGEGTFNREEESRKIASMSAGDKVFLYYPSDDVKVKDSPFAQYLPREYIVLGNTVVKVKCVGIGKVTSTNIEDLSVAVDWDKDYQGREWYLYTRQDGVWWFDGKTQDKYKAKALYDIVFNGKEQDYKWWAENGGFNVGNIIEQKANKNNQIKNIILYGSPGVGKTHNTNKLISLIESGLSEKEIFKTIKMNEPNNGVDIDSIRDRVKFVTFHQSFGYEDFIEGFRPNEDGKIELEVGVFKQICNEAQKNINSSKSDKAFDFESFLNDFILEVESQDSFTIATNLTILVKKKINGEFQSFKVGGRVKKQSLTKDIIQRDFEVFMDGNIAKYQDVKPTYESQSTYHGNAPYYFKLYEAMKKYLDTSNHNYESQKSELKNFYLIIDEINRGNISKIFGELITLIEEDKRDTLEVTLPYSKKPFNIPSNLYIIGTMNSTDKSIALIDIALRRRFTFLKMEPKIKLVENPKAQNIMKQLNEKITQTLGADYVLGHSYFMKVSNDDDLEFVLEYKIIPLLEEYYYGDDNGLNEVLKICKPDTVSNDNNE